MIQPNKNFLGQNYIFVFGFPGSGTTIFSKQLSKNLNSALWLEPYFIWRKKLKNKYFDNFQKKDFNEKIINQIRVDFYQFYKNSNKKILIEKEPRNILNFLIIKKIFPYSKFIFIRKNIKNNLRTIKKRINNRKTQNILLDIKDFFIKLNQQKYLKFIILLFLYELKNFDRIREYFKKYSKLGKINWGIKFKIKNKVYHLDSSQNFKLIEKMQKKKIKMLNREDYIVVSLEKLAKDFDLEYSKVINFIGKDKFKNRKMILDKKRIIKE